jgi:hypothetical protein
MFASVDCCLQETGTFTVNWNSKGQGLSVRTPQFDEDILQYFENNPSTIACTVGHTVSVDRYLV